MWQTGECSQTQQQEQERFNPDVGNIIRRVSNELIVKESHLLCQAGRSYCWSRGCVSSPVWHFAGHLGLKSSQLVHSKSSDPTGEPQLTPHPSAHGAAPFFSFPLISSCWCCWFFPSNPAPPPPLLSLFHPQNLQYRTSMLSVPDTEAKKCLVRVTC